MKLTLIVLILLACGRSIAQQKFIEVTVSDTVLTKADLFVYKIVLTSFEDLDQRTQMKTQRTFDSLKSVLSAEGFVLISPSLAESYNISRPEMSFLWTHILTHSIDSLGILYRQLRSQKGLTGLLELAVAQQDSAYQAKLYKKILDKAREKAETIAAQSNQHVQGVLAVTENKGEKDGTGGWTSYPPLSDIATSVIPGWHTTILSPAKGIIADPSLAGWYPLAGTFTVRFGVE
jgi:hypothetical protein